jgi:hypothetical protein
MVGGALLWIVARFRARRQGDDQTHMRRDRLIAATIAATPLLMPFYFDYDQLLLTVPAALFAGEIARRGLGASWIWRGDRWLVRIWPIHYLWLMLNPDIALLTRVNLTVPLWATVAALLMARAGRRESPAVAVEANQAAGLAAAA